MMEFFLAMLVFFPTSFLVYVMSERVNVVHQARVGKAITFFRFFIQSWVDMRADLKRENPLRFWGLFFLQLSIVFFLKLDFPGIFFIYLALGIFVLVMASPTGEAVEARIRSDRSQMRFLLGSILVFLSALGAFSSSSSGETSFTRLMWSPQMLVFVPLFQIGGMILFGEHPFSSYPHASRWRRSVRFYGWCWVASQLFLGGSLGRELFWVGHLEAAALFIFCRLVGQYFPRYAQSDLLRVVLIYLIPLAAFLWFGSALISALIFAEGRLV